MMALDEDGVIMQETAALMANLFPDEIPSIFIPYIVFQITEKRYEKIEIEQVTKDFSEMYGIQLDDLVVEKLCEEAIAKGYIYKLGNCYVSNPVKIQPQLFSKEYEKALSRYQDLKELYGRYIVEEKGLAPLANEELDETVLKIIQKVSVDTTLPADKSPDAYEMALNDFMLYANTEHPEIVDVINQFAVSDALWGVVAHESNTDRYFKKGAKIFLDTKCIFRLIGLEGEYWQRVFQAFVENVKNCGGEVMVFKHVMVEVNRIITDARRTYKFQDFDFGRASQVACQFRLEKYNDAKIDRILFNLNDNPALTCYDFSVKEYDYDKATDQFQIDYDVFKRMLVNTYRETNPNFSPEEKEFTIETDIRSIIMTYRLRGDAVPRAVRDVDYLFVTTNKSLAQAAKRYDKELGRERVGSVPVCLTANYLSTFIWLGQPTNYIRISKQKLLAYCYAAALPSKEQIETYLNEVEELKKDKSYSKEQLQYLRENRSLMRLYTIRSASAPEGKKPDFLEDFEIWKKQNAQYTKELEEKVTRHEEKDKKSHERKEQYQKNLTEFVDKHMNILKNVLLQILPAAITFGVALFLYFQVGFKGITVLSTLCCLIIAGFGVWVHTKKGQTTLRNCLEKIYNIIHVNELVKQDEDLSEDDLAESTSAKD